MSDASGDSGDNWKNAPDRSEPWLPPATKELIKNAGWKVSHQFKDKAFVLRTGPDQWGPITDALKTAKIECSIDMSGGTYTPRRVLVSIADLDTFVPGWREVTKTDELDDAIMYLRQNAVKREAAGQYWREGLRDPNQAVMVCKDADDADELVALLEGVNIEPRRQGKGGQVVLAPADELRRAGIEVKVVASEIAIESEDQQKSDAREWLKNCVTWTEPAEGSPIARAVFRNSDLVQIAVDNLLALKCTTDLQRLSRDTLMKDKRGFMLEVNADALKAAVPDVTIAPFNRARSTGEEGERRTGR